MPLDALCLYAAAEELRKTVVGARVDKVQQPEKDVFLLSLRAESGNVRLLVSAGSGSARAHLTRMQRENPNTPPMLCMLLRKHMTGARIKDIVQPEMERLFDIAFSAYDELGNPVEKRLVLEMLGRNSNLILIDGEGRILDCLRKIDDDMSEKRRLLPGLFYEYPPKPDKPSVFGLSAAELKTYCALAPSEAKAEKWLITAFSGLSPLLARELAFRTSSSADTAMGLIDGEQLYFELKRLREGDFTPIMLKDGQKPFDIYCAEVLQYGDALQTVNYGSFSELLDEFYTERERLDRLAQRGQTLVKTVKSRRDRAAKKYALRVQELKATEDRERLRQRGDIIKANIYRMSKGETILRAEDYYTEPAEIIDIPLEARLSPQQNAEKYYKAYNKAKNAEKVLHVQIEEARTELDYLESVLEELERAGGEKDLEEIKQELTKEGYIKDYGSGKSKKSKPAVSRPLRFISSSGAEILVGRNNVQNEDLTLKFAGKNDIWLHTQKIHGSHVIAFCDESDRTTLTEAAMLAAYYSKAREGSNVPVDYTRVRYVKKPPGAKTGMVIYTDYRTLFVTPDGGIVKRLAK